METPTVTLMSRAVARAAGYEIDDDREWLLVAPDGHFSFHIFEVAVSVAERYISAGLCTAVRYL